MADFACAYQAESSSKSEVETLDNNGGGDRSRTYCDSKVDF
jgi:hypothetical protein